MLLNLKMINRQPKRSDNENMAAEEKLKFSKDFFRHFWALFKPYFTSEEKWIAAGLLGISLICTVVGVRATVGMNEFNKNFFDALQHFDHQALINSLKDFAKVLVVSIIAYGYGIYFNGLLSVRWRRWMTKQYLDKWLHNHNHYRAQLGHLQVDNPDQRISDDADMFPAITLIIIFLVFNSILTLGSFGYVLWHLSGNFAFTMGSWHFVIPGYLLWGALLYSLLGTGMMSWIGRKLSHLQYFHQRFNADFRFSLIRLREASEQIALQKGEGEENKKCRHLFSRVFDNSLKITRLQRNMGLFKNGYDTTAYLVGIFMSLPMYLAKKIQMGTLMQISGAFSYVISSFSILLNSYSVFAEWRAVVYRLTEFNHSIEAARDQISGISIKEHDKQDIVIEDLRLSLPNGALLFDKLNLRFQAGGKFLLNAQSGFGKSTLLRALARIWPYGEGEIKLPRNKKIFFLPQKPYLPLGTLRDLLQYPDSAPFDDVALRAALTHANLADLSHKLDENKNWSHELSLGEQQLIAFARLFLHCPDIIFLDESTSALDEQTESTIYTHMQQLLPDSTIISVGHRSSLKAFHDDLILLSPSCV